jgi:Tfp pilus assembly protein PilF
VGHGTVTASTCPSRLAARSALAWLVAAALACAAQPRPVSAPGGAAPAEPEAVRILLDLGAEALRRGELAPARSRYERALAAAPESVEARVGLARLALAESRPDEAERMLAEALARDPEHPGALGASAVLLEARGDRAAARGALIRAQARDRWNPELHVQLARLTGRAPDGAETAAGEAALRLAAEHPYDPRARLAAGRALAAAGRPAEAQRQLEAALFAGDLAPSAARAAGLELGHLAAGRRAVAVHVFADEALRSDPTWPMRVRLAWRSVSDGLAPALGVIFYPERLAPFETAGAAADLGAVSDALRRAAGPGPADGVLAAFTGWPAPRSRGPWRLGQAEFLGRRLVVRLEPGQVQSRVLAHEVAHLFGGVHVVDEVDSLLNPSEGGERMDPLNATILRVMSARGFAPGGLEANVFSRVDLEAATSAYLQALRLNLAFRRLGLNEALEAARLSRYDAAARARQAGELDPHLGDVSAFVAHLLMHQGRRAEAIALLDAASTLHGPASLKGRRLRAEADRWLAAATLTPAAPRAEGVRH